MKHEDYVCSSCGESVYYDGRCGDGLVLACGCGLGEWVDDGRGGYYELTEAKPIHKSKYKK